ncbi:hypothetical protein ACQHIV_28205 [Kribbella sp. GL6]|uniref:hypothetical protein n=1 Tax=Kribbella sp. GL6 TaxID=3419765 RepID=UPI003D04EAEF
MEYAEFEVEYKRLSELIMSGRSDQIQPADITRLRALASQIDDEDDREDALLEVSGTEYVLAQGPDDEPPSEIVRQARAVYAEADRNDGTAAERLARAEAGMRELERIAQAGDPDERRAIGSLEHTLMMLIGALRNEAR